MVHVHTWTLYNFSERGTSLTARFRFHVSSVIGNRPQNSLSLLRAMDSALAEPPRSAAESVLGPALGHVQTMLCHCRLDARQTRGSVSPSPTMHHARSWPSHKRTKNELIMNHFASLVVVAPPLHRTWLFLLPPPPPYHPFHPDWIWASRLNYGFRRRK